MEQTPIWMVYIREYPIKIDDLGVPPFMETPYDVLISTNHNSIHLYCDQNIYPKLSLPFRVFEC